MNLPIPLPHDNESMAYAPGMPVHLFQVRLTPVHIRQARPLIAGIPDWPELLTFRPACRTPTSRGARLRTANLLALTERDPASTGIKSRASL